MNTPYQNYVPAMNKEALSVRPEDPLYMRPVSGLLGRAIGSPMTALTLLSSKPFQPGPEEKDVKPIIKQLAKNKHLENTEVYLNDVHPLSNLAKVWKHPKTSLLSKLYGSLASPVGDAYAALLRADHYNPYADTATIFTDEPGIVAHELGHAEDFNSGDYPGLYAFSRTMPLVQLATIPYQEYQASHNAMKTLDKTKGLSDEDLEHAGSLLNAGFGSYAGGLTGQLTGIPLLGLPAAWAGRAFGGKDSFGKTRKKKKD